MDTRNEKVVVKNNWWGIDPLTKDFCEHCNKMKWLSKMDNFEQGICKDCKFKHKGGLK